MIEVDGLTKHYGDLVAVDDVSFTVQAGQIFGLLGPNGAGKSTTIGCISGLLKPTSGQVSLLGHDVVTQGSASRRRLGVVPQELVLKAVRYQVEHSARIIKVCATAGVYSFAPETEGPSAAVAAREGITGNCRQNKHFLKETRVLPRPVHCNWPTSKRILG